ncbi:MAG TPA: bifunctional transaldolase/phosoglucose isomerase [Phototrophicaceae bacterium]|nr:bifunctional transaldolase/phosoglucose isomerase [Phototrophicaceae bacterium]
MAGNPPVDVQQYGQSIWLDFIRRSTIENGDLQRLIDNDGVVGVTSNPTIFQKAIGGSDDYDAALQHMLDLDANAAFEQLAVEDIQHAADLFRPVYDRTGGRDGYVSLEVSPLLANDTKSTAAEALRLFRLLNRPNVMIKIPATEAGLPAIEEAIAAGVNVNVTLIFGIANYLQVAEAYIRGLERRKAAGGDISRIASVASFFLSRIDVAVDRMLDNNIRAAQTRGDLGRVSLNNKLKGRTAIANAKVAYRHFKQIFYGQRFAELHDAGAMVQRVLWASTSTKNAAYSDTMYVDHLIGRDTVNTLPPETLKLFKDHGSIGETLEQAVDESQQSLDMLAEVGVNLDDVTHQLQVDGVDAFIESFEKLIEEVDAKRAVLKTGVIKQQEVALGVHMAQVQAAIKDLDYHKINARIWEHDANVWKDHPQIAARIRNRLGWLDVTKTIDLQRLIDLQTRTFAFDLKFVVLLGMGGSSLASEVISKTFGQIGGRPQFLMLDSTDPVNIQTLEAAIDLDHTLFIVSSKSGGTLETWSFYKYFYEKTGGKGAQFIAITDAGSVLEKEAKDKGFANVFLNPADIGGRYSALSYVGLVPAALMGVDLKRLWASAERMMSACGASISATDHPGLWLGAIMGALAAGGQDKVSLQTSPSIAAFGQWVEQLIAESTGKEGKGLVPVVGATVGKPHDYSTDRMFIYLRVKDDDNAEMDAGLTMLQQAGQPCVTLHLDDVYALGGEFFRWEYATAIAGKLLGINPFDEPNVTESKTNTSRLLDFYKQNGKLPETRPLVVSEAATIFADEKMAQVLYDLCTQHQYQHNTFSGVLAAQINASLAGDYFALLAYLPQAREIDDKLEEIRRRMRHVTRRAITLGYGPRFLHSTGQLHKGGANNGIYFQITCDHSSDISIPDAPYTFGVLEAAQAAGDLEALQSKGRRVIHLHLEGGDLLPGLQKLLDAVDLAGERRQ